MPPTTPDLNPVNVAVLLFTMFMGPQLAEVAGAYTIVCLGWFGGAIVGSLRLPPGRMKLGLFLVLSFILTMGLTVPLATFVSKLAPSYLPEAAKLTLSGLLFPVAALIPAIGHSWPEVVAWLWKRWRDRKSQPGALP